ncbi:MAG: efflux RND transporter permease subunit [Gammaproteobacteria bacterium]|nr:efflux RND transporter permease subunit [Gammaproteobacteria bacterium]
MNLTNISIRHPIATSLVMVGIAFLGFIAYAVLPIAGIPQVDVPTIHVSAQLPGASADTMASAVTSPLERALSNLPDVTSITSTSSLGNSSINVQFDLSRDVGTAAVDVQGAINAAMADLPKDLPHPPTYEKANPADALLMSIAVYSDGLPISTVDDYAENRLAPAIARVRGVGVVDYHGRQRPAIRVSLDPRKLASLGLTLEDVRKQIAAATVNGSKGTLNDVETSTVVEATDQLTRDAQYGNLAIATAGGRVARLRDVGTAVPGVEDEHQSAWVGGHQAVIVDVHKAAGHNVNATVQRVRAILPGLQRTLPASIHLMVLQDRTQAIRASVRDVKLTLFATCVLEVLVVDLFVGNWRATLIPAAAIPMSLLASMAGMYAAGYTLDNVSLMALTVSIGFVVDDAVVMLENVLRHVEAGEDPMSAALQGAGEIGFTIVAMTLSLVAVFIPVLFMGGIVGRVFREFAGTAAISILTSGFVSLTLTPVLCSRFLRAEDVRSTHRLHVASAAVQRRFLTAYERALDWTLGRAPLALAAFVAIAAASVALYWLIPKGFFPQQDDGLINGVAEAEPGISYAAMSLRVRALADVVRRDPAIADVFCYVETDPSTNIARVIADLKPLGERHTSIYAVMRRIQRRVRNFPGLALYLQAQQGVTVGAHITKTQFQYTLRDPDSEELRRWSPRMVQALRSLPELRDVAADADPVAPGVRVDLDRDAMARLGVSTQSVDDTLEDAFAQRQIASYYTSANVYRVIMDVAPRLQLDGAALHALYVPSQRGVPVQLAAISRLRRSAAPLTVNHDGLLPSVTLSFNLAPGIALGAAIAAVRAITASLDPPSALHASFSGSAAAFRASLTTQPLLIGAAILAIYIVLGMLYESYRHPLTILSTLPSAGIGGLLALELVHDDFSLIALIGVILLIGIVKKNGIMMVDRALALEAQGVEPATAARRAAHDRFRPIMMTTMVTLLAAVPLALAGGAGSELRRPLGIVMIGGLVLSQFLTVFTTPVIHVWMTGRGARAER